jgi:hypothetical protein
MNTTIQEAENSKLQKSLRQANRLWRRAGVRRPDRKELLSELEAELNGARHDGQNRLQEAHPCPSVYESTSSADMAQSRSARTGSRAHSFTPWG